MTELTFKDPDIGGFRQLLAAMTPPDGVRPSVEERRASTDAWGSQMPLPEGASYLGFIFAQGTTPEGVEGALRKAHAALTFRIDPAIPLRVA